jgi:uncharacterized OB-fold protein
MAYGFTFEQYQEALRDGRFVGLRCKSCGTVIFPPQSLCRECGSRDLGEEPLTGEGVIRTFTVVRVPPEGMKAPYIVAMVKLKEGAWAMGRLVGTDPDEADLSLIGKGVKAGSEPVQSDLNPDQPSHVLTFELKE